MRLTKYSIVLMALACSSSLLAAEDEKAVEIEYNMAPPAPAFQTPAQADAASAGCVTCHTDSDQKTMHESPAVILGCTDCHGGDASIRWTGELPPGDRLREDSQFLSTMETAHILPSYPESWHFPSSANPRGSYTLLNREAPEFIRFTNPSDYRVVREACGACHEPVIEAAERSLMASSAMLWGGAAYNNGILPFKNYVLGEAYTREGVAKAIQAPEEIDERAAARGALPVLYPLPAWETIPPADVFRVFEDGGRNLVNLFPETGLPNALGILQRLEEPGRPDIRQSNRGLATGNRIAVPVLNIHKTRLNDPNMWFMGTNDQPGDFRHSGCAACHVVYANDRDPRHSGPYSEFGHTGLTQTQDPMIPREEEGHPLKHAFTRAIPTSQCMICHMHQPNMFMNTYLGYTMWDYESDAPFMWPQEQHYPGNDEQMETLNRNPEEASIRGLWRDENFLRQVSEMNPDLKDTQFADYHGHGWNFRAIFKRDREGALLDDEGEVVSDENPEKFSEAVHMSSIHLDVGMHCSDCHFSQDSHGSGHITGEVMAGIEIRCVDCHGSAKSLPTLVTSGPAAPPKGNDLSLIRNPDGQKRFEWKDDKLIQRSVVTPGLEWEISLVKESVDPNSMNYNEKAAHAKLMSASPDQRWGPDIPAQDLAHGDDEMACYTCHTSWTTSCAGCHLPIQANRMADTKHFEGGTSRNLATYNPQVARDQMFQLGKHGDIKDGIIAPVRSSSALILSSQNANRERIYLQQPPVAASGFSSQAFAPHYPHTVRKTETKTCNDCHLSEANDNNAIMAQLLLLGTNFVNFVGGHVWAGGDGEVEGIRVTELDEPQAVLGSYLHRYAYPDWYQDHLDADRELQISSGNRSGPVGCLQARGEYLYVAEGKKGMRVYDVANIANKAFSQRIITAPFSPLGHDTRIRSKNATCMALPTNQPIHPDRNQGDLMRVTNREQPFHPIYNYALITDAEEGLILTDVNTLSDGEFRNNFLERALTWNPDGRLTGAQYLKIAGYFVYVATPEAVLVLNLDNPLQPEIAAEIPIRNARGLEVQFRYLFVTSTSGFHVVDVTLPAQPRVVEKAFRPMDDAWRVYVARTYAYIAAGSDGLVILDVTKPEEPTELSRFTANGALNDARDVIVGSTNASLFAYVADGRNGLKVLQLTSPDSQPRFYGFSPEPKPELIAVYSSRTSLNALSKGLDRDRGVDETGGQIAVFGRLGSRPFTLEEMQRLYLDEDGNTWFVDPDQL